MIDELMVLSFAISTRELLRARSIITGAANSDVTKLPFSNYSFGRIFFLKNFLENLFPEIFRKNLLPEEEFVTSRNTQKLLPEERHSECFRKKVLPEVSFFEKKYLILSNI